VIAISTTVAEMAATTWIELVRGFRCEKHIDLFSLRTIPDIGGPLCWSRITKDLLPQGMIAEKSRTGAPILDGMRIVTFCKREVRRQVKDIYKESVSLVASILL